MFNSALSKNQCWDQILNMVKTSLVYLRYSYNITNLQGDMQKIIFG